MIFYRCTAALVFSCSVTVTLCQGVEKTFYIDSCENFVTADKFVFRRVTTSVPGKPFEYTMVDYDREGNVYTSGLVKSRNGVTRQGDFVFRRSDGSVLAKGQYDKGLAVGTWIYYNKSGAEVPLNSLLDEAGIVRFEKDGLYREGKCICYILNGDVEEVTFSGERNVKTYRAGVAIATNGAYDVPEKLATYNPNMQAFYKFMNDNLGYPFMTRMAGREGQVYAKFRITKDGDVTEVKMMRPLDNETTKKVTKVLMKTSGRWTPGEFEGKKVDSYLILPVIFKLTPK